MARCLEITSRPIYVMCSLIVYLLGTTWWRSDSRVCHWVERRRSVTSCAWYHGAYVIRVFLQTQFRTTSCFLYTQIHRYCTLLDPCDAKNDWKQYSKTLHSYSFCCCDCSSHYYLYSCSSHIGILTPTPVIIATTILILIPILICSNLIPLSPLPCTPLSPLCPFTSNLCPFIDTLFQLDLPTLHHH